MKKRILCGCMCVLLLFGLTLPAMAESTTGISFEEYRVQLEQKFGIHIIYDKFENGAPIVDERELLTLETALNALTAPVVQQVSLYYANKTGNYLTYYLTNQVEQLYDDDLRVLGYFDDANAIIHLGIPPQNQPSLSGCAPITIIHEFAHAYHYMLEEYYGGEKMRAEWTALNGSVTNNEGYMVYPYNKTVFMSSYAASGYYEDFAETFAHTFARNKEGQGFYHRMAFGNKRTSLWSKVKYIEAMLPLYLNNTSAALQNLQKAYSTPVFINYQGYRFSGEEMQFIGLYPPKNVLPAILSLNGIQATKATWIYDIGGWYVEGSSTSYYVFPNGSGQELTYYSAA